MINWKAIANYLLTTIGFFFVGFFSVPFFGDGVTLKQQLMVGVTTGIASATSHVRDNPFKLQ